jgi:hypothetical protein
VTDVERGQRENKRLNMANRPLEFMEFAPGNLTPETRKEK